MRRDNLIAVRELRVAGRMVVVELSRNEGNSVAARCLLDSKDTPIIDAPSAEEAMATLEDVMEGVLLARGGANA
jgi:hypothetical protein